MRCRHFFVFLTPLLAMGCVGEAVDPSRATNHPANPSAPETPMTLSTPAAVASVMPGAPAAAMGDMPGMAGADHSMHMHDAPDGGSR